MSDTVPRTGTDTAAVPEDRERDQAQPEESEREPAPEHDPAAPAPLAVPRASTGHAEVDAQLERLADADHLATDGHVEVYEDVHRGLRDALTALDARPGPPAPAPSFDRRTPSPSHGSRS
ncbi:hypothetical protein [Streptomyces sp. NPDC058291]|uniref:hypothetical protein n=1 Tax=Streptomyces sp. NPDC058291 TaxID=3346427 RepID=UPI0036E2B345